jgi:signal transduction histidine kinase
VSSKANRPSAVASRTDRLKARAQVSRRQLALLHDIAVKANESDSARGALRHVLARFSQAHDWPVHHAYLMRRYPEPRLVPSLSNWRCSEPSRFRAFRRLTRDSVFRVGEGMVGVVAGRRKPRWIKDVSRAVPPVRMSAGDLEARSGLLIPVLIRWEPVAVAVLEFYSADTRRLSQGELQSASSVGALLGRVFERERAERQLAEGREIEQRNLGRELHDTVSQEITGITFMAERLAEEMEKAGSPLAEEMLEMVELLSKTRAKVHALSRGLLPIEVDARGLPRALEYLVSSVSKLHGVTCRLISDDEVDVGDPVSANHLLRIAQESIQNAIKHAKKADILEIVLQQRGPQVTLTVTDNGEGFARLRHGPGVGIRVMHHRAAAIGAELSVTSRPGQGTRVRCTYRRG